jgi:hypothetical protein
VKAEQAQIMSVIHPPSVKSINDIKLTLHTTFNILKGKGNNVITGSFVSPYSFNTSFCFRRVDVDYLYTTIC